MTQVRELAHSDQVIVDEHHTDQLLIYMAIANGTSEMLAKKPLSMHTQTMLVLLTMFRPELEIVQEPLENAVRIKITGLALMPDRT